MTRRPRGSEPRPRRAKRRARERRALAGGAARQLAPAVGPARLHDAARIAALLEAAPGCVPQSVAEIRARIGAYEVARDEAGLVVASAATLALEGGRRELRGVVVDPAWASRGLGRLLVERAVGRALRAGVELVCVTRAPAFFTRLGFVPIPLASVPPKPGVAGGPERVAMCHGATRRAARAPRRWRAARAAAPS